MAKHFKARQRSKGPIIAIIAVVVVVALLGGCFAVTHSGVLHTIADLFNEKQPTTTTTVPTTTTQTQPEPELEPQYAVPEDGGKRVFKNRQGKCRRDP